MFKWLAVQIKWLAVDVELLAVVRGSKLFKLELLAVIFRVVWGGEWW